MNKWLALLLIVIVVILDKHIGALISLKKLKSEEKIAEDNRRTAEMEERQAGLNKIEAEAKQLTAQLQKQTAERISAMNQEQIAAYNNTIASNCETCRRNMSSEYSLFTQQVIPRRFW